MQSVVSISRSHPDSFTTPASVFLSERPERESETTARNVFESQMDQKRLEKGINDPPLSFHSRRTKSLLPIPSHSQVYSRCRLVLPLRILFCIITCVSVLFACVSVLFYATNSAGDEISAYRRSRGYPSASLCSLICHSHLLPVHPLSSGKESGTRQMRSEQRPVRRMDPGGDGPLLTIHTRERHERMREARVRDKSSGSGPGIREQGSGESRDPKTRIRQSRTRCPRVHAGAGSGKEDKGNFWSTSPVCAAAAIIRKRCGQEDFPCHETRACRVCDVSPGCFEGGDEMLVTLVLSVSLAMAGSNTVPAFTEKVS
jgi:hypothetical protein